MGKLHGKVAIVTGANLVDAGLGIGGATALLMAREGARVVAADLVEEPVRRLVEKITSEGGEAVAVRADLRDEHDVQEMVGRAIRAFGGVHILHNNAAAMPRTDGDVVTLDASVWDTVMDVNARGTMLACKYAIPHMIKGGGGVIVNTSSIAGLTGDLARVAYGASKAAINNLTQYVATQYGRYGIRCNAICPGGTRTATYKATVTAQEAQMFLKHTLIPRLAEPEDIAKIVVFLASDDSALITGQVIAVDGGFLAHMPYYDDLIDLAAPAASQQ